MCCCLYIDEPDDRNLADLEVLVWDPARLPDDEQIDSFLIMTRLAMLLSCYTYAVIDSYRLYISLHL